MPARALREQIPASYLALVKRFPLVSIRDDRHLQQAFAMLDSLLARNPLDVGEELYLDALSDLVEVYENQHVNIPSPDPVEMLEHLMELRNLTQKQLAEATGIPKSVISEILARKREISRANVTKLASFFHVGPSVFLAE